MRMDVLRGFRGIKANLVINRDDSEQEDGEVSDESNVEYEGGDNAMQAINPGYRRKRSSATKINHSESTSRKGALERLKYLKYETKSKNHFERSSSGAGIHMFSPRHHDIESDFGIDDSTSGNTMDEERRSKKRRTDDTVDDEKYGSKSVERRYPQLSFSPSLLARHVEFSKGVDQPTTLRQRVERLILTPSAEMLNLGYPELRSHLVRMIHLDREQDRLLAGRKSQIDELRGMLKSIRKDVDRFMHQLPMHLRGDIHLPVSSATEIGVKPRNAEAFNISASEPQQTAVLNQQNSLPNRMNEQRFKFHMPPPNIGGTPVFSHSLAPQRLPPLPISLSNQLPSFGVPNVRPSASQPSYQHGLTGHPLPFQMGAKTNFNHPQTVMHGGGSALSSSMSSLGADNLPAARDSCIKLSASTSAAISHNVLESNSVKPGEAKSHAEVLDTTMGTQPRSNESYGAVVSLPVGISFPPPPQLYGRSTRNEQAPTLDSISVNPFMNASHPDAFPSSPVGSNIPPVIPASNSNNSGPSHVRCSDRTMPLVGNESHNFNANMPGTPYFKPPSDNQSIRAGSYSVSSMSRNSPQLAFSTASLDSSLAASNNEISKNNNSQMKTSVGSNISTIVDLPSEKLAGNLPILPMMNPSVPPPSFTMPPPRLGQVSSSFPMAPASTGHVTRVPASMNSSPSFPPNQMSSNLYSFPGPAPPIPMNLNCPPPNLSCPPVMPRYMHQGNPVNTPHNISGGPVPEAAVERNANTFRASSGEQRSNTEIDSKNAGKFGFQLTW